MTNRSIQFIFVFFISLYLVVNVFAENDFNNELSKARILVEQKSYSEALKIYASISQELRKDSGLMIEWARVYTYADNHGAAIKLFEEVRSVHPERSDELMRELADQYRWNNQKIQALQIYDQILKRLPDNQDALLGKADILSLGDKLEESYALYQKILDRNPENLSALNSQAKILVWQGYHRQGVKRYEEILQRYPKNPDAIEGMAFALHWLGDDVHAVERIKELLEFEPNRKEAKDLYYQIKGSQYPFARSYSRFTDDSTPQTVVTGGLRSGLHLDYSTSVDAIYEHQVLRKKGSLIPNISANRQGIGLGKSFGNTYEFNTFLYATQFNKVDFNPFTTNTWFTYKPDDYWRFDFAYDRETFEDNDALLNRVITNSPSISIDFRPDRFWFFNVKYKRSYFSDDNRQNQISSKIEYRLLQKPYIKLYYNYYYSDWGEPELSHGYFDPRSIRSHTLGAYSGLELTKRLFIEGKASGGYEFQSKPDVNHKKSDHPTFYTAASLNYRLADSWLVSASGDFFTTWPDHGERSYQKRGAYLSLTYNFGVSPVVLRDATRPYRTTGTN